MNINDLIHSLSSDQKETLQNYMEISQSNDVESAATVLEAHAWNLQDAINDHLEGSSTNTVMQDRVVGSGSSLPRQRHTDRNTNAGGHEDVQMLPQASSVASVPDVPQRVTNAQRPTPTMLALVTTPIQWGLRFLFTILNFILGLFPFLGIGTRRHRRRSTTRTNNLNSNDSRSSRSAAETAAVRFREEFVTVYGNKHPNFYQGTYLQALETAKREIRYFLAILHSEEHDDTPIFCRETLTSEAFIHFITDKNILVWAGNIRETEAFKVSSLLGAMAYPFMALIALQGSRMNVIHRFEGLEPVERVISKLRRLIDRFDPQLASLRAERASRDFDRVIREQQDAAYQASLRADQEKARKVQEELERQKREEEDRQRKLREREERISQRMQRKLELAASMPPEPLVSDKDIARLGIRLPNGQRLIRRFKATDSVQILWNFIETHDLSPIDADIDFVIVTPFPRHVFSNMQQTLRDAGLFPSASVVVEEKIDDDV